MERCEICNCPIFKDKKPFHELLCELNTLPIEEWTKENNARNLKFLNMMTNMVESEEKVSKLSYKELADFLIQSDFYGKMLIGSEDEAKFNRVIDILMMLDGNKENENKE